MRFTSTLVCHTNPKRKRGESHFPSHFPRLRFGLVCRLRLFGLCWIMALALVAAWPGLVSAADGQPAVTPELRGRAVSVLRGTLKEEQGRAKVRAADFLIALDYPDGVKESLVTEFEAADQRPGDRIGIWRLRARLAAGDRERKPWTDKICGVFLDTGAADRLRAAEALAESDPNLAEQLAQAAEAIERGDIAEARDAIQEAAQRMGEAGERVQRQEVVESTLAQLQEGREQIAQAGGT